MLNNSSGKKTLEQLLVISLEQNVDICKTECQYLKWGVFVHLNREILSFADVIKSQNT